MEEKKAAMLSVQNIYKCFGANSVLRGINLDVDCGEILSLIGGNGAGKSTLVKTIMGIHKPNDGKVFINGESLSFSSPAESLEKGVYLVPQEPMLFPNMTLEENVVIGIDGSKKDLHDSLLKYIDQLGWDLELKRSAQTLSIAEQQLVEILRGLLREAKILILDEPTSSLTFDEVNSLFKIIKDLKAKGITIIYITHRLSEVFEISTHVALMKDGVITSYGKVEDYTYDMLVAGLLNDDSGKSHSYKKLEKSILNYEETTPVCTIKDFCGYGFADINLNVYPGEILGMAGVVGAGRTELATTIFGRDKVLKDKIELNGEDVTGLKTKDVIKKGINYVPEDRFLHGIFKSINVKANLTSACLDDISGFVTDDASESKITQKYIDEFSVKVTGQDQILGDLSGGNQQKIVIGRGLSTNPKLIILDEPTRGIDASARSDVYAIIHELKKTGVAIWLISSDIDEVVALSDRVVTMYQGRLNSEFLNGDITTENIMAASFGVDKKKDK